MASNEINELAMMFKERDNKKQLGTLVGTVVSTSPLSISIGSITISGDRLFVAQNLLDRTEEVLLNGTKATIEYKEVLKVGDRVIINPTSDNQTYIATEKVGGM